MQSVNNARGMRNEPQGNEVLGYRCHFCSRTFFTSHAIAGHQKAHRSDANWRRGIRHERVPVVRVPVPVRIRRRILPMPAYPMLHPQPYNLVAPPGMGRVVPAMPPPFLLPHAGMVRSNPMIPFLLNMVDLSRLRDAFIAHLPAASSTNVRGRLQPILSERVLNQMFVEAFVGNPNPNPNRGGEQPAESQDSSATVVDERVYQHVTKGKGVEVHQNSKNEIDLELRL